MPDEVVYLSPILLQTPSTPQTDNQTMHSKWDSLEGKVEQLSELFSQILKDLGKLPIYRIQLDS